MHVSPLCCICAADNETRDHLFIHCPFTKKLWKNALHRLKSHVNFSSWDDLLLWSMAKQQHSPSTLRKLIMHTIIYAVWMQRNNIIHNSQHLSPDVVFKTIDRDIVNSINARRHRCSFRLLMSSVKLEEGTVKSLIEEKGVIKGVTYKTSSGEETTAYAPLTVVCDGCHSNLRRSLNENNAEIFSFFVGYISKNCRLQDPNHAHLIMSKPSFTLMYQLSRNEVRCVCEVSPDNVPSISNGDMITFLKNTIAPQIPPNLREVFMKGINEEAQIKVVPTKNLSAMLSEKKGVIMLGDAFNLRHPVVASGMMVLLSDILILRSLLEPLKSLKDANKISEVIKSFYNIRKFAFGILGPNFKVEGVRQTLSPANAAAYRKQFMIGTTF